ncbi:MAG: hypothetical protein M0R06_18080 [Sphaerochaeta sp.]|jgi:hypothetical protein|nr:hypothetical protein [Sphaerochaeta sp.]
MKMKPDDYVALQAKIFSLLAQAGMTAACYVAGYGHSAVRARWNLFYAANAHGEFTRLWDYLDGSHIDTALRQITEG